MTPLRRVAKDGVEVKGEPGGGALDPEVCWGAEGFAEEELVFGEAMDGFDVALTGRGLWRDEAVVAAEAVVQ